MQKSPSSTPVDVLKIDTGVKRIRINDTDNYLEFNPFDVGFRERLYAVMHETDTKRDEYEKRSKELDSHKETDEHNVPKNAPDAMALEREYCEDLRKKIDGLFGDKIVEKIFGEAISFYLLIKFFEGLEPVLKMIGAESKKKIDNYSPQDEHKPGPPTIKRKKHLKPMR